MALRERGQFPHPPVSDTMISLSLHLAFHASIFLQKSTADADANTIYQYSISNVQYSKIIIREEGSSDNHTLPY